MSLDIIKNTIIQHGSKAKLLIGKHSPAILLGVGTVSIIAGAVIACKQTLKIEEIMDDAEEKFMNIDAALDNPGLSYDELDAKKDRVLVTVQTGAKLVKLYLPAIGLGLLGFGCIFGSHHILNKRSIAMAATLKGVDTAFKEYRQRVADEFGEELEKKLRYDIRQETIEVEEEQEDGEVKKVEKEADVAAAPWHASPYMFVFDEHTSRQWCNDHAHNLLFLQSEQNYANDLLRTRGHVFLNEILDRLGLEHTQEGALVGWVYDDDDENPVGDNVVDFGIYNAYFDYGDDTKEGIILDFNVDGPIWNLI